MACGPQGREQAALTAGSLRGAACGRRSLAARSPQGREQLRSLRAAERTARVVTVARRVRPLPSAGWLPVRALRCDILPYVDAEFCQMLISISTEMNLCF